MEADSALSPPRCLSRIAQLVLEVGHGALLQLQLGPDEDHYNDDDDNDDEDHHERNNN